MKEREALKVAREALLPHKSTVLRWYTKVDEALDAIDKALAQPEEQHSCDKQEPVAMKFKIYKPTVPDPMRQGINNALLPWVYDQDRSSGFDASMWVTPVATLPPQRTWVGLTDEDKKEYVAQDFGGNRLDAMDWAEKRLKEKNT